MISGKNIKHQITKQELADWTYNVPESEIRRLLRYSPKYYFAGGKPGNLHLESLNMIFNEIMEQIDQKIKLLGPVSRHDLFDYGASEGLSGLRQVITKRLYEKDGLKINPKEDWNNLVIATGSQQSAYTLLRVLLNPNDVILVPRPTYLGFLGPAQIIGAKVISIPSDLEGIIPEGVRAACELSQKYLSRIPKAIYVQTFSDNPMGITLSEKRKKEIYDIAEEFNILIIEDAAYKEIRFDGTDKIKPIKSLDKENERVAYLGTTSKEAGVLRIGYTYLPEYLKTPFITAKGYLDLCTPVLNQEIARIYYEKYIDKSIVLIRDNYKKQANAMKKAIDAHLDGIRTNPSGGFFIWHRFDKSINTMSILSKAIEAGVIYVPGGAFYPIDSLAVDKNLTSLVKGEIRHDEMRLSFSLSKPKEISDGIELLGKIMK